jgi:hypothetical protein
LLPWILLSLFLTNIPQGQWGQPTSLGFSIVIGGFTIAALKTPPRKPRRPKIVVQGNKNAIEAKL